MGSWTLIAVFIAIAVGCVAQAVTGIGLGLVSSAVLIVVIGREPTVALLSLMSLPSLFAVLWKNRSGVLWGPALAMTIPAMVAVPILKIALASVDDAPLAIVAGALVIISVLLLHRGVRVVAFAGLGGAVVTGIVSSAMHMVGGTGSPAVALYSMNADWDAVRSRGTLQVYFASLCVVTAVSIGLPSGAGSVLGTALAAMVVGTVAGVVLATRVSERLALQLTKALAAFGGALLIAYGGIESLS